MTHPVEDASMATLLEQRYGRTPRRLSRRAWAWLGTILVVIATVAVVVFAVRQPSSAVSAKTATSAVDAQGDAVVRFTLNTSPGIAVRCALDARGEGQDQVGWKYVDVPASDEPTRTITETVQTFRPALAGSLQSCWQVD
ncbi:MAG: DUF4307 domain-containing protein [Pseudoclavibacter caeni]|jgi:hypothetical protein